MALDGKKTVIYDFGAHGGEDLEYYLLKADKVVAVEANPAQAAKISNRFAKEIFEGRLVLENCAVTEDRQSVAITLYVHKKSPVVSTIVEPIAYRAEYSAIQVDTAAVADLFERHGVPLFVKIDLEGYDVPVLRAVLRYHHLPDYISVECHDTAVLGMLSGFGDYGSFKISRGRDIGSTISDLEFVSADGQRRIHTFPSHSAGPFGEDLPGEWMNYRDTFARMFLEESGWYDLHARVGPAPGDLDSFELRPEYVLRVMTLFAPRITRRVRKTKKIIAGLGQRLMVLVQSSLRSQRRGMSAD